MSAILIIAKVGKLEHWLVRSAKMFTFVDLLNAFVQQKRTNFLLASWLMMKSWTCETIGNFQDKADPLNNFLTPTPSYTYNCYITLVADWYHSLHIYFKSGEKNHQWSYCKEMQQPALVNRNSSIMLHDYARPQGTKNSMSLKIDEKTDFLYATMYRW